MVSTEAYIFFAVACITNIKDLSQANFIQCCLRMILFYNEKCRIIKITNTNQGERIFTVIIKDKVLLYG